MIRSINHSSKDYALCISGISWKKNYQNLFDYDERSNDHLVSFNFQLMLNHSFFLVTRDKETLELKVEHRKELRKINDKQIKQGTQLVCAGKMSIKQRVFMLKLYQPDQVIKQTEQNPNFYTQHHIVVRSIKNQQKQPIGYQLKSNNILKLGNCEFFIHLVHNQCLPSPANSFQKKKSQLSQFMSIDEIKFFINNNQKVYDAGLEENFPDAQCKYCMMPEEGEDFLCSPCKCSGSCAMVHFGCLVKWNKHKVKKSQGKGCVQYNFQKFFCQVCKEEYPQYIKKHKKVYEIMPVQKPKGSHIVLEALNSTKRHVIIIENVGSQGLVLGRGQQCNLKLDDPTISRRHAVIMQEQSQFRIFDLKSKFGTLIRDISMVFPLKKNQKFSIQSGRSVISFELQKKSAQKLFQ